MRFPILSIFLIGWLALPVAGTQAQEISKPVKWSHELTPKPVKAGDVVEIRFKGLLENEWFIYSIDNDTLDYVTPARFVFMPNPTYELDGKISAKNVVNHRDDVLEEDFRVLKNDAVFVQRIIVKKLPLRIDAKLHYTLSKEDDDGGTVVELEEAFKIR